MSKSIALGLLCAGAILLAILLTGCSDAPSPTPSAGAVPSPTATAQPGVTPEPTPAPTLAPTHTPTPEPTPTPAAATLPLGVYLTLCAPPEQVLADDATYGDLSSVLAAEADRLEALTPPAQLSEWHLVNIEAYRTAQAGVDTQLKDDVMVDNPTMNAVEDDFTEKLREAAARVPEDVRQQMIEAHCIDPDVVPDDYTDVPDSQGDDIESTTVAAATLSLDEYLTLCATTEQDLADDATFGDFSSLFAAEADRLEALTPPVQLSEWHLLNIENFRTIQAFVDLQPKDDVIDVARFFLMAAISADSEEKLRAAAARLPEDVRQQMIEAGCIDPEDVLDDHEDVPDDHGNDIDDATAIRVGTEVRGAVDYDDDIDFFRFQAERGQSYQIDVALGTLDDSIVELYDVDWSFLDTNDDYGDTYASRLYWEAPRSGERYVAVYGYGTGTYTLTVSLSDLIDDHGNSEGDATAIRVGTEVRGAVDYDGDIDLFRFQAERGQSYQIDVALGTLDDSIVDLYDADGSYLDASYDYGDPYASRLYWEAPSSGERYVAVEGYGTGTYTLTVSLVDDHGNDFESATRIAIGEAVAIELANLDDMEVLVFRLAPDREYVFTLDWETYQIWDNPGSIMALYDAGGRVLVSLDDYDFSEQRIRNKIIWHAVTGGDYYIVVGDENTLGDFALTVTEGEATEPIATPAPTEPFTPPASSFVSVSAGESHTCGVKSDGSVVCWGNDENGRATPPAGSFDSVSTGWFHTCGVRSDGSVACWGANHFGQATPPAGTFVSVSAAWVHNCGVRSDGSAACWGNNASGEATPPAGSFNSVSAGDDHTCGVRSDGSVACWGDNEDGEATPPAGSFVSVSAGGDHTCGARSDDSVACWGDDFAGDATPPAGSFVSVSAGRSHTCGVRSDGSVVCWGYTRAGAATPPAGSFVSVSAGGSHTCGVRIDGSVACWGSNYWGSDYYGQATPPE